MKLTLSSSIVRISPLIRVEKGVSTQISREKAQHPHGENPDSSLISEDFGGYWLYVSQN